jgi:hypothetical protein
MRIEQHRRLLVLFVATAFVYSNAAFASSVLSFSDHTRSGSRTDVVVPITVETADGLTAAEIAFGYDPDVARPVAVHRTPYTARCDLTYDLSEPGLVSISLDSADPLTGRGELAWVSFRVVGEPESGTSLSWRRFVLDHGRTQPVLLDGYLEATTLSESVVSLPDDAQGGTGETVVVPLSAVPADGIQGIDVKVQFNDAVVQITDVTSTPITQSAALTPNYTTPGVLHLSVFQVSPGLAGSGPIADIHFHVVGTTGESTALDIFYVDINEGAITATIDDGMFSVCSHADADGDTFSSCDGDCDDDDDGQFPGNPEICDGVDNDCNDVVDDGIPPVPTTCGVGECAGNAGERTCVGGSEVDSCDPLAGAVPEECDGLDNNCDGSTDEGFTDTNDDGEADCVDDDDDGDGSNDVDDCAPLDPLIFPAVDVSGVTVESGEPTSLVWDDQGPSALYDVATGLLSSMIPDQGTENGECLDADIGAASTVDPRPAPAAGDGYYYLVRAETPCGNGTYGISTAGQDRTPLVDCP